MILVLPQEIREREHALAQLSAVEELTHADRELNEIKTVYGDIEKSCPFIPDGFSCGHRYTSDDISLREDCKEKLNTCLYQAARVSLNKYVEEQKTLEVKRKALNIIDSILGFMNRVGLESGFRYEEAVKNLMGSM